MIVYASRGAIIRHGMPGCACGSDMFFSSLEDALAASPERAHLHPDFKDWTRRQVDAAVRDARKVPAERIRCGGCSAWVGATNALCSCGFHNDARGGRNYGRWIEGASRAKADLPF